MLGQRGINANQLQHDAILKGRARNKRLRDEYGSNFLGGGMYGWVLKKGNTAVKCFERLDHLIQEWAALKYLDGTRHLVQPIKVDFDRKEITTELYNSSLDAWLLKNRSASLDNKLILMRNVLQGLVEIHDRELTHGDLKPANILVRNGSGGLEAVVSDCGFLSVNKYARTHLTSQLYQEPPHDTQLDTFKNYYHHPGHDVYSYALVFTEVLVGYAIERHTNTHKAVIEDTEVALKNAGFHKYIKPVLDMLNPDIKKRSTARSALYHMFGLAPVVDNLLVRDCGASSLTVDDFLLPRERRHQIKHEIMKYNLVLNRCYIGYKAMCNHLKTQGVPEQMDIRYVEALIIILYSLFRTRDAVNVGEEGRKRHFVTKKPNWDVLSINVPNIIGILSRLMNDEVFISILLQRSCSQ